MKIKFIRLIISFSTYFLFTVASSYPTQAASILAGNFKFENQAPIYYSNGKGHYCWYENMESFSRLAGNSGWTTLSGRLVDYDMTYDGICTGGASRPAFHPAPTPIPVGNFKFKNQAPIYYSNGKGHYCWYENMESFSRLAGNSGLRIQGSRLSNYGNIYDGICTGGASRPAAHPDPNF
jgi:hypothetical protein